MKGLVRWQGDVRFEGVSESGHLISMDGPPDKGGQDAGARPMELVLLGLGGCASFDVITILKKARQSVTDCEVSLTAERADSVPAVFTEIQLHFVVTGFALAQKHVERAIALSAKKYCSASQMLVAGGVSISDSFEIREAEA